MRRFESLYRRLRARLDPNYVYEEEDDDDEDEESEEFIERVEDDDDAYDNDRHQNVGDRDTSWMLGVEASRNLWAFDRQRRRRVRQQQQQPYQPQQQQQPFYQLNSQQHSSQQNRHRSNRYQSHRHQSHQNRPYPLPNPSSSSTWFSYLRPFASFGVAHHAHNPARRRYQSQQSSASANANQNTQHESSVVHRSNSYYRNGNGDSNSNNNRYHSNPTLPSTRRRRRQYHRRREQQIVWQNGRQIDALLMNFVEAVSQTFSEFNPILVMFVLLCVVFVLLQTRHVFFYRQQWTAICEFFDSAGVSDRNQVEEFADHFGCFTLIGCINIIVNHAVIFQKSLQKTPFLGDLPGGEQSFDLLHFTDNYELFERNHYSYNLVLAAIDRKEELIVREVFYTEGIPTKSQRHFIQLFNIQTLSHLTTIYETLENPYSSPTKIIAQNLETLERQFLKDLSNSHKHFLAKYCPESITTTEQNNCAIKHIWHKLLQGDRSHRWNIGRWITYIMILLALVSLWRYSEVLVQWVVSICDWFRRDCMSSSRTVLEFAFESPMKVENTLMFRVLFYKLNNDPYEVMPDDDVIVDVSNEQRDLRTTIEKSLTANEWQVWFPARNSGEYLIRVIVNGKHVQNSPYYLRLLPAEPSPSNIRVMNYSSSIVTSPVAQTNLLEIELRDKYDNACTEEGNFDAFLHGFTFDVHDIVSKAQVFPSFIWESKQDKPANFTLFWTLPNYGMFQAEIFYQKKPIISGRFQILSLSPEELKDLETYSTQNQNQKIHTFDAKLLPTFYSRTNSPQSLTLISKSKSVTCLLSSKQIVIQDYFLRFIPRPVATIRVCPSTKLYFGRDYLQDSSTQINPSLSSSSSTSSSSSPSPSSSPLAIDVSNDNDQILRCPDKNQFVIIDDGSQNPYELLIPNRNIFVATYSKIVLNNIGGSETFHDKESYFMQELCRVHSDIHSRENMPRTVLLIDRSRIVESTMNCIKGFNINLWKLQFDVIFIGEEGVDYGGLRKEWFDLLCKELFEPKDCQEKSLFCSFANNKQGFVHPNAKCKLPLSHYEFAGKIVGKGLLDAALGAGAKCLVNARFTRSFLLQLIGMSVNYRHFETDDPELFISKVQFLLENDVGELELYFTEDEYDGYGKLVTTHDLVPKGSKIKVTDANKREYLSKLAQHRLSTRVNDKIQAFLRGLSFLIPDELLSIFDANELELLICGAETYSLSDLRLHHEFQSSTSDDNRILSWFWKSLSGFSDEEMARLLQFTTGSSRLPARGFSDLTPTFNIMISPEFCYGKLPVAHTCFNQICLPDYDSYQEFDRCLRTAITEGSQGFGLS